MSEPFDNPDLIEHVLCLLKSFKHWLGYELIPIQKADSLFYQPFVVLSHGIEIDPILNYGNKIALSLWEMTFEEFTKTPSRLTAEPPNRDEREKFLTTVKTQGYIDNYRGVRISKNGRRFFIENVIVWNIIDENNKYKGQAATFNKWKYL